MHFITKRTSATGKKFQAIADKSTEITKANKKVAKEIGFKEWRLGYWLVYGGFSSILFKDAPDGKVWKKVNGSSNEWMPRMNVKAGKEIQAKLDSTPRVTIDELNQCIGFDGAPFKTIGFAQNNKDYFGFVVGESWGATIPNDCKEVTVSKYKELFK